MNRIEKAFEKGKALIGFLTAGDPAVKDSVKFILDMEKAGMDIIEIGVPFSDPVADGPVILEADQRALSHGIYMEQVLEQAAAVRAESEIPIILLTYYNSVFSYGKERFFSQCETIGIDGIILPDMPLEEQGEIRGPAEKHGVSIIQMVALTSEERIRSLAQVASGFIYVVSSMGVTGMRSEFGKGLKDIIQIIREETDIPVAVGFGIHTPEQAAAAAEMADGVITGSAIVDIVGRFGTEASPHLCSYIRSMKSAIRQ